jgi:hypothetical protein
VAVARREEHRYTAGHDPAWAQRGPERYSWQNKTKVTHPEARKEGPEKPPETPDALLPLFDLSDAAV